MEIEELLDFTASVGESLLESGAETSRVEDTLKRIITKFYDGDNEVLVVLTGFFVNIGTYTKTVRVRKRITNLDKVAKINMLSREIVAGKVDFDGAKRRFRAITRLRPYPIWLKIIAVAVSGAFFTFLNGGALSDGLNSFLTGAAMYYIVWKLRSMHTANFIVTLTGGAVIAVLVSALRSIGLGSDINAMITGAIVPLVPGLAITNAIRDIIAGDYLSGGARLFDAVVVAVALAVGAGGVMYMMGYMTGGIA